tara:strand:- start:991 stop:1155 length:165 start_codon:yes stop_codon:yes gene_type:complete
MIKHYTIGYFDDQQRHQDTYVDAENCWEAKNNAENNSSYLQEHPHSIDYILLDD